MKVAIIHDYFNKEGGGERMVLDLAAHLKADIYAGFVEEEKTHKDLKNHTVYSLGEPINNPLLRAFKLYKRFANIEYKKEYDLYIFSGTTCMAAFEKSTPHIWYCHTPARHLYSEYKWFLSENPVWKRPIIAAVFGYLRRKDQQYIKHVQLIGSNSQNIKNRIKKFYGPEYAKRTSIVYGPVTLERFKALKSKDYYVSWARIDALKRVKMIVEAFTQMPDKKLVVLADGPDMPKVRKLAEGHDNIEIVGRVKPEELAEYASKAIASIYIPIDEDFGLTPIESMAAGKPCIGVKDGGLKETIIHKKTGYLCPKDVTTEDVIKAVKWCSKERAAGMKKDCIEQSKKFSKERFYERMDDLIAKVKR